MKQWLIISGGVVIIAVAALIISNQLRPERKALSTATVLPSLSEYPTISTPALEAGECVISGCSRQICSDSPVVTTCEWRQEFICYRNARCERQANGRCEWTQTPELISCLRQFSEY